MLVEMWSVKLGNKPDVLHWKVGGGRKECVRLFSVCVCVVCVYVCIHECVSVCGLLTVGCGVFRWTGTLLTKSLPLLSANGRLFSVCVCVVCVYVCIHECESVCGLLTVGCGVFRWTGTLLTKPLPLLSANWS